MKPAKTNFRPGSGDQRWLMASYGFPVPSNAKFGNTSGKCTLSSLGRDGISSGLKPRQRGWSADMSWIQKLHDTYERCADVPQFAGNPLLPISHRTSTPSALRQDSILRGGLSRARRKKEVFPYRLHQTAKTLVQLQFRSSQSQGRTRIC